MKKKKAGSKVTQCNEENEMENWIKTSTSTLLVMFEFMNWKKDPKKDTECKAGIAKKKQSKRRKIWNK